ncbi:hypothetical protein MNBD_CHLOROFLEXI01-4714, partial [hydrothermal vent metagenome]
GDQFGSALGQFYEPVGITVGNDGFVYVADTWNGRIQQFTPDLIPVNEWLLDTGWPANTSINNKPYLAVDSGGRVYITDPEFPRVLIFGPNGSYLGKFGQFGTDANSFNQINGIFIDGQDNIYIADAGNNRVLKYAPVFAPVVPVEEPVEAPEESVEEDTVEEPVEEIEEGDGDTAVEPTEPANDE